MSLILRNYSFENINLKFYSFIHPETGELWATANDIAKSLGYSDPANAIFKNIKNTTFKSKWITLIEGLGKIPTPPNWQQNTMMINEGGINRLIMSCHLGGSIDKFKDWICGKILPSIRKTGKFEIQVNERDDNNDLMVLAKGLLESNKALIALSNRMADMVQDVVSKPESKKLLHTLSLHELESKDIAFTRCQRRYLKKALKRLAMKDPSARQIYNVDYVPNGINVLNCVKECLREEKKDFEAKHNVIKMLNDMSPEQVVAVVKKVVDRPFNRAVVSSNNE